MHSLRPSIDRANALCITHRHLVAEELPGRFKASGYIRSYKAFHGAVAIGLGLDCWSRVEGLRASTLEDIGFAWSHASKRRNSGNEMTSGPCIARLVASAWL